MKLGEFFVELLVDAGKGSLTVKDLVGKFGELDAIAASVVGGLTVVGDKFAALADRAFEAAAGFEMFTSQTGLSAQELQQWQIIAEQAGTSASAVQSSVSGLQRQLAEIRMGRGNIAPFQILGVDTRQSAFGVLTQLREKLRGMDRATATNLIAQMGLDPSMIQLLTLSQRQFNEFAKTVSGMSAAQERAFLRGRLAMTQFNLTARQTGYDLVAAFGPAFTRGLEGATSVLSLIGSTLAGIMNDMETFPAAAKLMVASISLLAFALAPVTSAFVALLLVLEDVAVYLHGGKSLTGDVMDFFNRNQKAFAGAGGDAFKMFKGTLLPFAAAGTAAAGAARGVTNILNQEIHSTASASEVARHAVAEHKKQINDAALQSNNGGY